MNAANLIALGSFSLTLLSMTVGSLFWLKQKSSTTLAEQRLKASEQARHEVNQERDFNHLKGNVAQLTEGMGLLIDEIREVKHELSEVKTLLLSRHGRDD